MEPRLILAYAAIGILLVGLLVLILRVRHNSSEGQRKRDDKRHRIEEDLHRTVMDAKEDRPDRS